MLSLPSSLGFSENLYGTKIAGTKWIYKLKNGKLSNKNDIPFPVEYTM